MTKLQIIKFKYTYQITQGTLFPQVNTIFHFSWIRTYGHISRYILSSYHILYNHITLFCLNKRDLKANCRCNDVQALLSPNPHKTRLGRKIHVKGEMSEINDYSNLAFLQVGQNWREQKALLPLHSASIFTKSPILCNVQNKFGWSQKQFILSKPNF